MKVLGKIGKFITGTVPSVLKLGEAVTLLMSLISVKVAKQDMATVKELAIIGEQLGHLFIALGQEVVEFFVELATAAADGKLDSAEINHLLNEADDVVPVVSEISKKAAELTRQMKALM